MARVELALQCFLNRRARVWSRQREAGAPKAGPAKARAVDARDAVQDAHEIDEGRRATLVVGDGSPGSGDERRETQVASAQAARPRWSAPAP